METIIIIAARWTRRHGWSEQAMVWMRTAVSTILLLIAAATLAILAAALLAAAVQLGFDLAGSGVGKTVEMGGGSIAIGEAELQVSLVVALTFGLLLVVPAFLFARRGLHMAARALNKERAAWGRPS